MKQSENFTLCGYLIPKEVSRNSADMARIRRSLYFLISEKGFQRIPTEKKTLYMELM